MSKLLDVEMVENEVVLGKILYPISKNDINSLIKEYKNIPNIDVDADDDTVAKQYDFVLKGHKAFVKARNNIEKTRKELKAPALEYGKKVDDIAKEFTKLLSGVEQKLLLERTKVEENEARKQREAEEAEELRVSSIKSKISDIQKLPVYHINSDVNTLHEVLKSLDEAFDFQEFFDEAMDVKVVAQNTIKNMIENANMVENARKIEAQREEKQRLEDEAREAEMKQQREAFEAERLAFEKAKEDFARAQREALEEQQRLEAELEAERLMKQQEQERKDLELRNSMMLEKAKEDTLENMKKISTYERLLEEIIVGNIPNIKWEIDYAS